MENRFNTAVSHLVRTSNLPLENEINELREFILSVQPQLTENVKWNGPNFVYNEQDRITMRIHAPKMIQLIFHRGAKIQEQPSGRLIEDSSGLLQWKANDRAVATFKNQADLESSKEALREIIITWLQKD